MASMKVKFKLPSNLIRLIEAIEEEFEVYPAEMLRIGMLDTMKQVPVVTSSKADSLFEITIPKSLQKRIMQNAKSQRISADFLAETVLWAMCKGFPQSVQLRSMRDNKAGIKKVGDLVESDSWW